MIVVLPAEASEDLLLSDSFRVDVEFVERGEDVLGVAVLGVSHPAAGLHLVCVEAPVAKFLLEQGSADIQRIVELAGSIVVENLGKDAGVAIEEVFV